MQIRAFTNSLNCFNPTSKFPHKRGAFSRSKKSLTVFCPGCLIYGLPPICEAYSYQILPRIAPLLIPLIHAALMTSVYCTVILSLERYVRICYLCQLKDWSYPYVTEKNIHYYKIGLILLPIMFYLPKFFEVSWIYQKVQNLNSNRRFASNIAIATLANFWWII